jgi:ABC-type glycerol-3-phosphate transport system substrate-binding protein
MAITKQRQLLLLLLLLLLLRATATAATATATTTTTTTTTHNNNGRTGRMTDRRAGTDRQTATKQHPHPDVGGIMLAT